MKRMHQQRVVVTAAVLVVACVAQSSTSSPAREPSAEAPAWREIDSTFRQMADSLDHADVARDVEAALRRGDRRLLGVQRYDLQLPGVSDERYHELKNRLGVRVLEHTSDAVT